MAGFVIVTVLAALVALVTPITILPNATLAGPTVNPAPAAGAALVARMPSRTTNARVRTFRWDETVAPLEV